MLERGITPMLRGLAGVLRGFNPLVRGYNTVGTGIKPTRLILGSVTGQSRGVYITPDAPAVDPEALWYVQLSATQALKYYE